VRYIQDNTYAAKCATLKKILVIQSALQSRQYLCCKVRDIQEYEHDTRNYKAGHPRVITYHVFILLLSLPSDVICPIKARFVYFGINIFLCDPNINA
jgi:hypothetical protein